MGYEKVRVLEADTTISLGQVNKQTGKTDPKSIEGYYLGFKNVEGDYGTVKLHHFETQSGVVAVWGKTKLDSGLAQVKIGNMVLATFTGLGKPSKGRQPSRLFDIQQDPDNRIDVLPMSSAVEKFETVEQDDGDEDDVQGYGNESDDTENQDAVQEAALAAAASRKAAVLAQLKAKGLKK